MIGPKDPPETGAHTDFSKAETYGDYLHLDSLLACQQPKSDHHDEMMFVIIHQATELWMKLILHEVAAATKCVAADDLNQAQKMLARVSRIESQLIQSWDVLSTLTPTEYLGFRDRLGQASGFQSWQYRMIEFALGNKAAENGAGQPQPVRRSAAPAGAARLRHRRRPYRARLDPSLPAR